ncbi:helix-turn-helix transcriptional regulator [Sphingobacterium sp. JUb78]|uniref:helix-turn-helix transcriptional regulator n=2 Tax=Sphingobacteriaceae TaxID=84566 RepID=UPI001FB362C2|nr:metalloregulator ArsR/SmtB family transcription factor [Sphingobacterium sp. JUb78]
MNNKTTKYLFYYFMTTNRILMLLKMRGPLTALDIAHELKITKEGVRQQLVKFMDEGLIEVETESKGVGRPQKYFNISELGNSKFPDTHAELTVKLLTIIKESIGTEALQTIIEVNEATGKKRYHEEIDPLPNLKSKIERLVAIRTREGYMADYTEDDEGYLLVENHCPICAAAKVCQGFCASELQIFQSVLGESVLVQRTDHIIAGARRCAYRIVSSAKGFE